MSNIFFPSGQPSDPPHPSKQAPNLNGVQKLALLIWIYTLHGHMNSLNTTIDDLKQQISSAVDDLVPGSNYKDKFLECLNHEGQDPSKLAKLAHVANVSET
ncbi:hypothetical protein F5Y16DRAFT_406116 [Xylariaceae sp. FL0255]|nr:hypothetical protein F5Y16DRAFT_406116 [Xylariaceae sp. FL0255]